jgi:serine/threonine-protein kinase
MGQGILWCPHCKAPHVLGTKICPATAKTIDRDLHNPSARDRQHPLIGALVGEKYLVARLIGRGGIADVFEAENKVLGRPVALKVVRLAADPNAGARLLREADLVAAIQHPNICDVYDTGTLPDGSPFIVLERLSGETFDALLKRPRLMAFAAMAQIFLQILSGLSAAHGANIVHRDLKPKNVFLVDRLGLAPLVKLLDFGLAKDLSGRRGRSITLPGISVGTPAYMSPEQIRGEPASIRSDLFAVAVMLYQTLTGEHPFAAPDHLQLATKLIQCEPPPPEELRPDLPPVLGELLQRALAKDPDERFPTALEFQKELRHALASLPRRWNESIPPDTVPDSGSPSQSPRSGRRG